MAAGGAKKRIEENASRLAQLRTYMATALAFYCVCAALRLGALRAEKRWWLGLVLASSAAAEGGALWRAAPRRPTIRAPCASPAGAHPLRPLSFLPACFSPLPQRLLSLHARPTLGPKGEIVDGGGDLKAGGLMEHCFDVIYLTLFVHATAVLFRWSWLALLAARWVQGSARKRMLCGSPWGFTVSRFRVLLPWGPPRPAAEAAAALQVPTYAGYRLMKDVVVPYCLTPSEEELAARQQKRGGKPARRQQRG